MEQKNVLAIDIGSGSGRGILGCYVPSRGLVATQEIHRFENGYIRVGDHLYWDYMRIYRGILDCMHACKARGITPDSLGIDSWAQDYAYISGTGEVLGLPRCYHDPVFNVHGDDLERDLMQTSAEISRRNGTAYGRFQTMRQLWYDRKYRREIFSVAHTWLHIPYLMVYLLTGEACYDDTLMTIGGMADANTLQVCPATVNLLGIGHMMPRRCARGERIGCTGAAVAAETGLESIPVLCVDAHDTASAVAAIPDEGDFLWISSGSYNMFGAVLRQTGLNDTMYERRMSRTLLGDGRLCVMSGGGGMFYVQQCMKKWKSRGLELTYPELTEYALAHPDEKFFRFEDVEDASEDMPASMNAALVKNGFTPAGTPHELYEAFCNSLARQTAEGIDCMEEELGRRFDRLYNISGGSLADAYNCRLARQTGKTVLAGLQEASSMGNMLAQLEGLGVPREKAVAADAGSGMFEMRRFLP